MVSELEDKKITHTDGKNITKDVLLLTLHYKVGSRPYPQTLDKAGRSVREKNSSLLGPFISDEDEHSPTLYYL